VLDIALGQLAQLLGELEGRWLGHGILQGASVGCAPP
jgi:hypothetical protein